MEMKDGVRIYEGKLDSISTGQVHNGAMTKYALIEIGDDAPNNVKVLNGLDGKLRSSVGDEVKLWIAKGEILVGIETAEGKTYMISRSATKGLAVLTYSAIGVVGFSLFATFAFHPMWSGAVIGAVLGFGPRIPAMLANARIRGGITEVEKNPGKVIEVSG